MKRARSEITTLALGLCIAAVALASAPGALGAQVTLHASRPAVPFGKPVTIFGRVGGAPPGTLVKVRASAYPHTPARTRDFTLHTAAQGGFSLSDRPGRNTRYRVVVPQSPARHQAIVRVVVDPRESFHVRKLPLGRVKVTIAIRHSRGLPWNGKPTAWYLGQGKRGALRRVKATRSAWAGGGKTRLTAELAVPRAGAFRYAACLGAPARRAMGPPADHRRCGKERFRGGRQATLQGRGRVPFGFPSRHRIDAAASYLKTRAGRKAFAVVTSEGRIYGQDLHRTFVSASVVKAMLLVAYLRMVAADHRDLTSSDRSILDPMIEVSDNSAATRAWQIVGNDRLRRLAARAGMTDFSIVGDWATAQISAADQAGFFFAMHRVLPRHFRTYADYLLSHIAGYESWGIPAVARPAGWRVYFKGGWRGTSLGQLVHQVARLKNHGKRIAIAAMTDGDPSMSYGIGTIEGVTAKLIR